MKLAKYALCVLLGFTIGVVLYARDTEEVPAVAQEEPLVKVDEADLFSKIVIFKQQNGLKAPVLDKSLCEVAQMRLGVVAEDFEHTGFEKDWTFEITPLAHLAENLSMDGVFNPIRSSSDVIHGWIQSPPHKEALLRSDTHACVECALIDATDDGVNNPINYCVYISGSY